MINNKCSLVFTYSTLIIPFSILASFFSNGDTVRRPCPDVTFTDTHTGVNLEGPSSQGQPLPIKPSDGLVIHM